MINGTGIKVLCVQEFSAVYIDIWHLKIAGKV